MRAHWIFGSACLPYPSPCVFLLLVEFTEGSSGGRKNLGVHLCLFSRFRWSQGLVGFFGGG